MIRARRAVRVLVAAAVLGGLVPAGTIRPATVSAACDGAQLSASQLNTIFASPGIGAGGGVAGFAGGDYQHVYPLPDGRKLWLFQDMFFSNDNDLRDSLTMAAHNAGLVQNGTCWSLVGGPRMNNYIGSSLTTPLRRWFWPLDGEIGADGKLWIFMVEMRNPNGTGATWGAAPSGTWVARIDPSTLQVLSFTGAPDFGPRLYGWSVTSDSEWSYLYGQCYRQFINQVNGVGQFDSTCTPHAYLARVPKGRFDLAPSYWASGSWTPNWWEAQPLMTRGTVNPMNVQRFDTADGPLYVNVTKIDDWWGAWVYVDKAPNPWGPWEQAQAPIWIVDSSKCSQCGIYHAHLLPYLDANGQMILSWSNGGPFNLWQANANLYRPSFVNVPLPSFRADAPASGLGLVPRPVVRALDTREVGRRMKGGTVLTVDLAGYTPSGAVGVVANLTAVNPSLNAPIGPGFLTAWPCGARMPTASVLNHRPGRATANGVHVRLNPARQLCIYSSRDTDVIVDVTGAYVPSGGIGLHPLTGSTVADTSIDGSGQPVARRTTLTVPIAGQGGVPAVGAPDAAGAVTLTITASGSSAGGFVTVWPCHLARPTASTLNFVAGDTVSNSTTIAPSPDGEVCVYAHESAHIRVDVDGWWSSTGLRARLDLARRVLDTRSGSRPAAGSVTTVDLAAVVPVGTTALIGNMAVPQPPSAGVVRLFDCESPPQGPTVVHVAGETRAGLGLSRLNGARQVCLTPTSSTHLVLDAMVTF